MHSKTLEKCTGAFCLSACSCGHCTMPLPAGELPLLYWLPATPAMRHFCHLNYWHDGKTKYKQGNATLSILTRMKNHPHNEEISAPKPKGEKKDRGKKGTQRRTQKKWMVWGQSCPAVGPFPCASAFSRKPEPTMGPFCHPDCAFWLWSTQLIASLAFLTKCSLYSQPSPSAAAATHLWCWSWIFPLPIQGSVIIECASSIYPKNHWYLELCKSFFCCCFGFL